MTFPMFDGSEPLAWLTRANQYFLINKTPSDRRVDVAIKAISGPATPWLKLLLMRCSSLSWDKFTQELLRRFGDAAIATVRVAKIQPKIPPTSNDITATILPSLPNVTAPLLSSSPSTTAQQEISAINTSTNHPDLGTKKDNSAPLPLPEQHPIPPPICITLPSRVRLPTPAMVTAPPLSSSSDTLQFQPPVLPLLQRLVPASAADHAKLMVSSTPPTKAMVSAPLLPSSPDIQIWPPCLPLLRCLVSAASHQSMQTMVSFPGFPYAAVGAPFSYLVMLQLLHIVCHLQWFDALATNGKHEFEPPPRKCCVSILSSTLRARLFRE